MKTVCKIVSYSLLCFLVFSCKSSLQNQIKKEKYSFQILLGSCFDDDEISIIINDKQLLKSNEVKTNPILGITQNSILYYEYNNKGRFVIFNNGDEKSLDFMVGQTLNLEIVKNGIKNNFEINTKKGKNIIIDGCEEVYKNRVTINQSNKKIILD